MIDQALLAVRAPREIIGYVKDGTVLTENRGRVQVLGRVIHDAFGFQGMQDTALHLRIAYELCSDTTWKGHPQEVDFAWEGIGGWLP